MTVLPAVPPLMPKVSVASLLGLLATKVPLVAVKTSNTAVSISVGPVIAFSVGGVGGGGGNFAKMMSGGETKIDPGSSRQFLRRGKVVGLNEIDRLHR